MTGNNAGTCPECGDEYLHITTLEHHSGDGRGLEMHIHEKEGMMITEVCDHIPGGEDS